jgi:copper chaperone NosL
VRRSSLWLFLLLSLWCGKLFGGEDRGHPACDYCRMIITEKHYGGKIKTVKGTTLIFDATECMAAFVIRSMVKPAEIQSLWSVNFSQPGRMLNAGTAWYLRSSSTMSPMGINLAACASRAEAERMRQKHPGELLKWTEVLNLVKEKWFPEMLGGPRRRN